MAIPYRFCCLGDNDVLLELWHQRGVEDDPAVHYDSGNNEPKRCVTENMRGSF